MYTIKFIIHIWSVNPYNKFLVNNYSQNLFLFYKNCNKLAFNQPLNKKLHLENSNIYNTSFKKKKLYSQQVFPIYINIAFYNYNYFNKVHPSFSSIYIGVSSKTKLVVNIIKVLSIWTNLSMYIYNIYYYNLKPILLGTNFFKNEINSLNWIKFSKFNLNLKYVNLILPFKPFHISNLSYKYFMLISKLNVKSSIVLDIIYHKSTITFFKKNSIFILGIVPTIYNLYTVDLALPTSSDNIFIQLFFLKFIIKSIKIVEKDKYSLTLNTWNNYLN